MTYPKRNQWTVGVAVFLFAGVGFLMVSWFSMKVAQQRKGVCLDNLRRVGLALRQYLADNDDYWPPESAWTNNEISPIPLSGCPSAAPLPTVDPPLHESGVTGYAYNRIMSGDASLGVSGFEFRPVRNAQIAHPQWTIAVFDYMRGVPVTPALNPFPPPFEYPSVFEKGWQRHQGGGHYLFCDGHIGWYKSERIYVTRTEICHGEGDAPTFCKD